ncbi:nucleoside deaminase [Flavobacterium sufflavum]|uniref:Nucleoside deaminase n=1 Tax=Flavobacterium sufflavum TaxID=1921138 RepID=A0A437KTE9_9FLAO|nr:nucleoside deaminase [Flavobacterium sufflavum]RVT75388.1 nucleoside deaminase [Flavobacterium sufflavum]
MKNEYNEIFMQRAIELSQIAYKTGKGLPIGCVIVKDNKIIGEGHNEIFSRNNPTAHGEMVAIENACKNLGDLALTDCAIYTTLEPCPMCLGAIYWAKLNVIYFANSNEMASKIGFNDNFIFDEIKLQPEKRKIPMFKKEDRKAIKILTDWKSNEIPSSQPW